MMDDLTWEESPLYTFDCSWCCAIDLLRANRIEEGRAPMKFWDFPRQLTADVEATVYMVDDMNQFGEQLRGHVAIADYHGGWLVWLADDLRIAMEAIPATVKGSEPKYETGEAVSFKTERRTMTGTVSGVDYRGRERRCFKGCDWSYDIMVERNPEHGDPCLFKHIPECDVERMA